MDDSMTNRAAIVSALEYAARGWPVLLCRPGGKEALTRRGVNGATTDPDIIRRWFAMAPNANLAVACGAPGPQVQDIDDLDRVPRELLRLLDRSGAPVVATSRGRHYYFAGQTTGTVTVGFGELRGAGGYVIAPPSVHPSGREYVWLFAPGDGPLPPVPAAVDGVLGRATTAGAGEHQAPAELVPYGQRHPYLRDFVVRLVCAGVTDQRRLLEHLRCEFRLACEPEPSPPPGALEALARWAVRSRIAERERRYATRTG
jgi:hypothetical protein